MKKLLILTAVLATAVFIWVAATLPPRRLALAPSSDGSIAGIIHVHTNRSDGLSSPEEAARAAARAGLKFIVFTDHGDATRAADPPTYRYAVLCLDGVEISTNGGHYIAIDMAPSPYPLAGDARDVVEDVRRLGGFGIVAHPDSPKPQLRWQDWTTRFDGIELLNLDTSWRVLAAHPGWRSKWQLATAFVDYPFRAPEVMASLIQPTQALERWEAAAASRRVVVVAGADAHAKLALPNADPGDSRFVVPVPGYESSFRVMSIHVQLERPLTGDARSDAAELIRALRGGHLYTAIDALASPPSFEFTATNGNGTVHEGDDLGVNGPVQLRIRSNAPADFTTVVYEGAKIISSVRDTGDLIVHASERPAVYRVEIGESGRQPSMTWIRSNPIYVRGSSSTERTVPERRSPIATMAVFDGTSTKGWHVEHDALSASSVEIAGDELRFRYGLAGGAAAGQVTALVADTPTGIGAYDRLTFAVRSERPMRISIQLRDRATNRWQRSVYVDPAGRERTVVFDDFSPVDSVGSPRPPTADVRSILFVIDTTNTKPGSLGQIWIRSVALER